ncbi:CRISPR-associated helicase Cas3' [Glycomyces sp. NPDC047010]|uniref:CRISPR-associated helicase Cas3' n=1 Tax=Glycomyces sp. NPDC047010 TaxID=3155023 RepID=UPI0033C8D100
MKIAWNASEFDSAVLTCWGKSSHSDDGGWMPLHRHLSDTAAVARHLFHRFLPDSVRRTLAAALPGGEDDAAVLCAWLAGVHDIGKATPAFAMQVPKLFAAMEAEGLTAQEQVKADRRQAPHATAGMLILDEWLEQRHNWDPQRTKQISIVVGGHHGLPPDGIQCEAALSRPHLLGWSRQDHPHWRRTQFALLDWAAESSGAVDRLGDWRQVKLPQQVQVLLTGLVIMADWIASNPALFPYRTDTAFDQARIRSGLAELDLTAPWNAVVPEPGDHLLSARFGLPKHYRLRPVQRTALAEAAAAPGAGLMIIEAPMGEGKTEAALLAAEALAAKSGAGGCYIALPTRATSDAMFDRALEWARRLPDRRVERGDHSIALAHAKAFANTRFTRLFHRGAASAVAQDETGSGPDARLIAHWWMAGRKKTMFNSFVVGTIDQLLFAALKAKHLAMRHLGLAGKVVIIDEAHAYDVYMGVYLDTALEWLALYGVPVVILSATLPAQRRCELVAAYEKGRNGPRPKPGRRRRAVPTPAELHPELLGDIGYPAVITAGTEGPVRITPVESSGRATAVEVRALKDDPASLIALLQRELDGGGCALVIRNTVKRVQQTAQDLRDAFGPELVTVAHSRFAAPDRADKDELLRTLFGPPGNGHKRPAKHIVVASQVAEQSLDIDFDLLVTDLAPADLVLQRMGRLHRHERPERTLPARCYLTGVDWEAETPEPVPGSVRVYGAWTLLRSAAVLHPYLDGGRMVILPGDIAPLVQSAYGTIDIGPASWLPAFATAEARARAKRADQLHRATTYRIQSPSAPGSPILGWLHGGDPLQDEESPEGRAMVRDIPVDTLEVLLIARDGDQFTTLPWLKRHRRVVLPTTTCPDDDLAKAVAATTLNLPVEMSTPDVIAALERRHPWLDAWQSSRDLEGQLVLDIDPDAGTDLAGFHLDYDRHDGLRVRRL